MKIEIKELYKKVISDNGFYLTYYKEGDDIKTFNDNIIIICPLTDKLEGLCEIDEETHIRLNKELEEILIRENGSTQ